MIRIHPLRAARAIAAAFALLAITGGLAGANAAPAPKFDPATPAQIADAKAQAAAAGATCDIGKVRFLGTAKVTKDKKETEVQAYEITCASGFGYLVQGPKGGSPDSSAQACPALKASHEAAAKKEQYQLCQFPENQDFIGQMQTVVSKAGLACTVAKQRWMGLTKTHQDVYEISCVEPSPGYVLTVAHDAQPVTHESCLRTGGGVTCTLTTPAQQTSWIGGIAAKSGRACEVTKARWVGTSKSEGLDYYEVGCAAGVGFMIETDGAAVFKRAIPCADAGPIAGGCTLSDQKAVQASAIDSFSERLKALGISCAVLNARVIGKETRFHREVVEYACSDRPVGLIVVLPDSESPKSEQFDCVSAAKFGAECQFTSRAKLLTVLTAAMTAGGKTCAVTDFKWHGAYADDTTEVEVACSGAPGYLTEMSLDYAKAKKSESCAAAAKEGDPCDLPGNKVP